MKVLVTGAAGFVGGRLVERLVSDGEELRVLVRNRCDDFQWSPEASRRIECVEGSVTNLEDVQNAVSGVQAVVHLAALGSPATEAAFLSDMMHSNVGGTANVLVAAADARVKRFILASSAAVYGNPVRTPIDELVPSAPISAYGVSKQAAEELCRVYEEQHGMSAIALRFFNIYGSKLRRQGSGSMAIPHFIRAIEDGKTITLRAQGTSRRDFVHIDDAVDALVQTVRCDSALPRVMNIGSGVATSMREVVQIVADQMPDRIVDVREEAGGPGDILESVADIRRAQKYLGFRPRVSIQDGIRMMVREGDSRESGRLKALG